MCRPRTAFIGVEHIVPFWVGAILSAALIVSAIPQVSLADAFPVVNQSSLTIAPDDPLTATIRQTSYGPQLFVGGLVAERTSAGERLTEAVIEIIVTRADGSPLWSGESYPLGPGKRVDWRVSLKPNGALDGTLITQVILRDRRVSTVEGREREEREATLAREREARERAEPERYASIAAVFPVVNQSSLTFAPDDPLTATIRQTSNGPELFVGGLVADRTSAGERLYFAIIEIIVTQADGIPIWSVESYPLGPGKRLNWRVSVKPNGALDGTLITQAILRDRRVSTVESKERAEREEAEAKRQEELSRERAERKRAEAERQAILKRERERVASIKSRGWPKHVERAVIDREVKVGMTSEQVSLSWGQPIRVNKTIRASDVSEQWVFSIDRYVYFENGIVTTIQTSH